MPQEPYNGYELPSVLTGHAMRQVCFDIPDAPEYRRAFWGKIFELTDFWRWTKTTYGDERGKTAAEYWEQILYSNLLRFLSEDDCTPDDTCRSYPPSAPFIQWFPNDPYYSPDFVGEGYNSPAWYLATTASNVAYGSSVGDVITSLDRFPPGSLPSIIPASGLPRFRINVSGAGTVKVQLVNLWGGSLIQTTIDDDIGTLKFTDVSRDTISVPPETQDELTLEFDLATPGAHWIDFIVISWVNSSIPFLHHGGGLRKVELCGFETMPVITPPFRFTEECGLEYYNGEAWIPVDGWEEFAPACFTGPAGADGADGADGATLHIRDAGTGQLETSPDAETWSNVTNAHYLHINADNDPLTGGLSIHPALDTVPSLVVRHAVASPTQSLFKFQNSAGNTLFEMTYDRMLDFYGETARARFDKSGYELIFNRPTNNFITVDDGSGDVGNTEILALRNRATVALACHSLGRVTVGNAVARTAALYVSNNVTGNPTLVSRAMTSQTGDLIDGRNASDLDIFRVLVNGSVILGFNDGFGNVVHDGLTVYGQPTGNTAQGHGVAIRLKGKSSTTNKREMASIKGFWTNHTDASRKGALSLHVHDTVEREVMTFGTDGTKPDLSVFGKIPRSPQIDVGAIDCQGNAGTKAALDALVAFGYVTGTISLGEAPTPEEPVAQFDRCTVASRGANMIMDIYVQTAGDAIILGGFFANEIDSTFARVGGFLPDYILISAWAEDIVSEFPGLDPTPHIDAIEEYRDELIQWLYCSLTEDGCFNQGSKELLLVFTESADTHLQFFQQFIAAFYASGLSQMISSGLLANCNEDVDCSGFECGNWNVSMNFTLDDWSDSITLIVGDYELGTGYFAVNEATLRIEIPFHIIYANFTVCGSESGLSPLQIRVENLTTSVFTDLTPYLDCRSYEWSGNSPDGIAIEITAPAGTLAESILTNILLGGLGVEPVPDV